MFEALEEYKKLKKGIIKYSKVIARG